MEDCMNIAIVGGPSSRRATDTIVNAIHDMNIMKYIRTDKDDDGKDIFFVKGFTHIYHRKDKAYRDAKIWYDIIDRKKADKWLLDKYDDNNLIEGE